MINKVIHYCWFGRNPLPPIAKKCISSWKKHLPDFEIKEWNEDNFDVNIIPYTQTAYAAKKYAFVSDYARFYLLEKHGGIYMDIDVEILKPLHTFLHHNTFFGFETNDGVNPGIMLGSVSNSAILQEILDFYNKQDSFINTSTGKIDTIVTITTNILIKHKLRADGSLQNFEDFTVYPVEYFSPVSFITGEKKITKKTYSIHHFNASWCSPITRLRIRLQKFRTFRFLYKLTRLIRNI